VTVPLPLFFSIGGALIPRNQMTYYLLSKDAIGLEFQDPTTPQAMPLRSHRDGVTADLGFTPP
jgi:hypothetical protein